MSVKLLTEHHLEFLCLTGGCTGSYESTHVKMPDCWKSHVAAHIVVCFISMASAILNNSLMEQRQKKAMEELEKEMQIELERNKEQLNNELQLALEKELQNHKGDFLNQLAAASNLSRQEIDDVVSNAAMGKNFITTLT